MSDDQDIRIKALYASVVEDEDEGLLFIGFAEGEGEDEPYALFRQPLGGGPIWFEAGDEALGAEDAVETLTLTEKGLEVAIAPARQSRFAFAPRVQIRITPATEDADLAIEALRAIFGPRFIG